jgi:hypothetical protein
MFFFMIASDTLKNSWRKNKAQYFLEKKTVSKRERDLKEEDSILFSYFFLIHDQEN